MYDGLHFELDETKYLLGKTLGSGSYGVVVKAFDTSAKNYVAVKQIPRLFEDAENTKKTLREVLILNGIRNCEYIMTLQDVELSQTSMYLISELCEKDLYAVINSDTLFTKFDDNLRIKVMYQTLNALSYMHSAGVLHRDIKPANILLDANSNVRVCDFGWARVAHRCEVFVEQSDPQLTEYVASRWYRAPEVALVPGRYGKVSDVWSAGCTFVELYKREPLFPGNSVVHQLHVIADVLGTPSAEDLSFSMPDRSRRYMSSLQSAQIGLAKAVTGASVIPADVFKLLEAMLALNPSRRVSSYAAMCHPIFDVVRDSSADSIHQLTDSINIDLSPIETCGNSSDALSALAKKIVGDFQAEMMSSQSTAQSASHSPPQERPPEASASTSSSSSSVRRGLDDLLPKTRSKATVQRVIQRRRSSVPGPSESITAPTNSLVHVHVHVHVNADGWAASNTNTKPTRNHPEIRRVISNLQTALTQSISGAVSSGRKSATVLDAGVNHATASMSALMPKMIPQPPMTFSNKASFRRKRESTQHAVGGLSIVSVDILDSVVEEGQGDASLAGSQQQQSNTGDVCASQQTSSKASSSNSAKASSFRDTKTFVSRSKKYSSAHFGNATNSSVSVFNAGGASVKRASSKASMVCEVIPESPRPSKGFSESPRKTMIPAKTISPNASQATPRRTQSLMAPFDVPEGGAEERANAGGVSAKRRTSSKASVVREVIPESPRPSKGLSESPRKTTISTKSVSASPSQANTK